MSTPKIIDFNQPRLMGEELDFVVQAFKNHMIAGNGPFCQEVQTLLAQQLHCQKVLLTTSCTHALEMVAILLDLQPDDEVIVPSYTFVSSALAFVMHGAKIVFADIRADTLNIDETQLPSLITKKTRAIVVVHYAGVACEMDTITKLVEERDIVLIEDNAHGLYGQYKANYLGSFGTFATQSFHETKNITCGEGGALIINEPSYNERAEIIQEKGTNRSLYFRGQIDKYSWVDKGSSYVLSDILAAFLYAQIKNATAIQAKRQSIWHRYYNGLGIWANDNKVKLPYVPAHCKQAFHMFYLIFPSFNCRTRFIQYANKLNIKVVFHYVPLHSSKMGRQNSDNNNDCTVSEQISQTLLRLPFHNGLSDTDLSTVIEHIKRFKTQDT